MIKLIFVGLTFVSTLLGGLFAIKFRNKLTLIMGFVAGVILGVACFDILPDIINLIRTYNFSTTEAMIALMVGFILFHILEKVFAMHHSHESDYPDHKHPQVGILSAVALILHSVMDGIGIGVGFKLSESIGILVSLAVISHDFTDGMNTVTLLLINHNSVKKARIFLLLDAIAPIIGVLLTIFFVLSNYLLFLYMSFFAGFLIYISASDILPEAHKNKNSVLLISLTLTGIIFIFIITNLLK